MEYSGFVIRRERLLKNWSQEGLCKGICAVSYLSKIEQGKTQSSTEILSALFKKLEIEWICDEKELFEGKKFVEEWYDAAFSLDFERLSSFKEQFEENFFNLKNSPFAIDIMLLEKFGEENPSPLDEKLEVCMDKRQLALQKVFSGDFYSGEKLYPSAYMSYRRGYDFYEKGENSAALEHLQKAYNLASEEGMARIMMFSKMFMSNCYSNTKDIDGMNRHGKIAKRLALELGEKDFIRVLDYNLAATKIENGDYLGAYEYFSVLEEPSAFALHKLAVCCEKLGKTEEAILALEKEKNAPEEPKSYKILADKASELVLFRLNNKNYLSLPEYGKLLLEFFDNCKKNFPAGYAKFHLPWVLEWHTANRQYKQAFELIDEFS